MQRPLPSTYRYIRLSVVPPMQDALTLRKAVQDGLGQLFGITSSSVYVDILWINDDGSQFVLRVNEGDAGKLLAAVATTGEPPRLSLIKQSTFLPALLSLTT
ncbi:hypothetical protein AX15_007858 [Amanita polypyramis BW_CC]|nr:hypothetical protein AX15_007858 [Amanita polypyramis BW_CC]